MASGETFDIRHPEMARIGQSSLILFTFVGDSPDVYDHWQTLSLLLMERVSHPDATVPAGNN